MVVNIMDEEVAVSVLQEIKQIIDNQEIRCWIDQGVLLGAVRDGKFIPWDTDIDFGILYRDAKKILQQIPTFKQKGYSVWIHCSWLTLVKNNIPVSFATYQPRGNVYFHIDYPSKTFYLRKLQTFYDVATFRELQSIRGKTAKLAYLTTTPGFVRWLVQRISFRLWRLGGGEYFAYATPKHFYENLDTIEFYGMEFNTPSPVKDYLSYKYGDYWSKPKSDWNIWVDDGGIVSSKKIEKKFDRWYTLKDLL